MARILLGKIKTKEVYSTTGETIVWTAGDPINGNSFIATGKELVLARNTHATAAQTVTVLSVECSHKRLGNVVHELAAGAYAVLGLFPLPGWQQADGKINIDVTDAAVELAVIQGD